MAVIHLIEAGAVTGGNTASDANDGSTWALAKLTLSGALASMGTNSANTLKIAKVADPVVIGTNVSMTISSKTLTLPADIIRTINNCESVWTAATNVVASADTTVYKQGSYSAKFAVAAGFTTGKIAHFQLPLQLDLSGYTKISFWARASIALAGSCLQIKLCSDSIGNVPVDTFTITDPLSLAANTVLTLNKGAPLGSNINSIAVYAIVDPAAVDLYFDNFIACNDFSLSSLISHVSTYAEWQTNTAYTAGTIIRPTMAACRTMLMICRTSGTTGATEPVYPIGYKRKYTDGTAIFEVYTEDTSQWWHPIQSLDGAAGGSVTCLIDNAPATLANGGRGWNAPTGTYNIRSINPIFDVPAAALTTGVRLFTKAGASLSQLSQYSGGWDPTANVINGVTFYDGKNGFGAVSVVSTLSYCSVANIGYVRVGTVTPSTTGNFVFIRKIFAIGSGGAGGNFILSSRGVSYNDIVTINSSPTTATWYAYSSDENKFSNLANVGAGAIGVGLYINANFIRVLIVNSGSYGVSVSAFQNFGSISYLEIRNSAVSSIVVNAAQTSSRLRLKNCKLLDSSEVNSVAGGWFLASENHDDTEGNHKIFGDGVNCQYSSTGGYNNSHCWRVNLTSIIRNADYPFMFGGGGNDLMQFLLKVKQATPVTCSIYVNRSASNINAKLICRAIEETDFVEVTSTATTIGSWEKLEITVVPSAVLNNGWALIPLYVDIWDGVGIVNTVDISGPFAQSKDSTVELNKNLGVLNYGSPIIYDDLAQSITIPRVASCDTVAPLCKEREF